MSLLKICDLSVELRQARVLSHDSISLLRDINLSIEAGETCALVGESGAGKSMLARTVLGLLPSTAHITGGQVLFEKENLLQKSPRALRQVVGRRISLVPQDPMVALNPTRKMGVHMTDALRLHLRLDKKTARQRALDLLDEVLIRDPQRVFDAYAHELSGGMRQRVLIAMAFSVEPSMIIADEPTTALDVTVQKRVLSLLRRMQQKHNTSILFVTHDMGVVAKLCERVVVMYAGRILEDSPAAQVLTQPQHAYPQALIEATPRYDEPEKPIKPVPDALLSELDNG